MRRETTNVLLLLVGGALVKITVDGTYLRYVKPTAEPWVLAAGLVMIGLAAISIARDIAAHDPVEIHQHTGRWVWLLMLPVLAIVLIAPPALGADTVLRTGNRPPPTTARQRTATFPPLPNKAVIPLAMSDFITRSVWDASNSLNHRTVALTGFVVHENETTYVARLVITCCAADATPMKVALTGHQADQLPNDQWIEATGTLRPGSATTANGYTPTITVTSLTTVDPPADPYEY
jgi:uncharacterized repeat protein (TIGR03943 family)